MRQSGLEYKKVKSTQRLNEDHYPPHTSVSTKIIKQEQVESPLKKSEGLKRTKNNNTSTL